MIVQFNSKNSTPKLIGELHQYDYGQQLHIHGLDLPEVVEIGFSFTKTGGVDIPRFGITEDGVTVVTIPDLILEGNDTTSNFYFYAFIFVEDEESGETVKRIELYVKSRPKRWMDDETGDTFSEVVKAVQELVEEYKKSGLSDEQVAQALEKHLEKNPINITVDSVLSTESENPVQNKVVALALKEKLDSSKLSESINTALAQAKESGEFNGKDGQDGQDGYTPQKGVDYFDGEDGKDGKDGIDGKTPVKGTDYFTTEDKKELVTDVLASLPTWQGGAY